MNFVSSRARRGFTLIELLVVIAIIGILSSVVLASLNTARAKGNYAAIKSNLATIQTQAELYYDAQTPNGYATGTVSSCAAVAGSLFNDTTIQGAIQSATNAGGTAVCAATATTYKVTVTSTAGNWCINNTGVASTTGC